MKVGSGVTASRIQAGSRRWSVIVEAGPSKLKEKKASGYHGALVFSITAMSSESVRISALVRM